MQSDYGNKVISELGKHEYRVYFTNKNGDLISPLSDIPLWVDKANGIGNMIVEIPRGTHPKLEMNVCAPLNPIKQDVKKGALRSIHDAYPFNYGAFAQTWEDPAFTDPRTQAKGDFDPIDVCEVGTTLFKTGDVVAVKILGVWAMIDEGETDWKILAINTADENASKYNDIGDVPQDVKDRVFTFLRDYKIPAGSGPNQFAFNSELQPKALALEVVEQTHHHWNDCIVGKTPSETPKGTFSIGVTSNIEGAKVRYTQEDANKFFSEQEAFKSNL
jgi:inorganic pyrophosphatase